MDKLIGVILGLFLMIAVIYFICIVVAYIVLGILIVAVVAGPPTLAGLGLRSRLRRFQLSRRKVWQCVLLGLALFALPLLAILADESLWPAAVWTGCFMGLAGPMTYLAIEGYRQVIWPHRKVAMAEAAMARRLGWSLWTRRRQLRRLEKTIRREDDRHGALRRELGHVRELAREIVLRTDPAFYSAEVARWTHACASMADNALQQRANALPADALISTLERSVQRLPELASQTPGQIRGLLQAAVIHAEALRRAAGGHDGSYEEDVRKARALSSEIDALNPRFVAAQDNKVKAAETIRRLRKERVAIQ